MSQSLGLLILRVGAALHLAVLHGWPKLADFSSKSDSFPDPLGLGGTFSLVLALAAEFVCAIAVGLGLFTRLAAIPVVCFFLVAAFMHHSGDPWAAREPALLYLFMFLPLVFTGGGEVSIDHLLKQGREKKH